MSGFAADRTSGASAVAAAFLGELERWTAVDRSTDSTTFQASLLRFLRDAQAAQPSMALVHQLAARALDVATTGVRRGDKVVDLRGHLVQSCRTEREDLAAARAGVARTAAGLIERRGGWIATLSRSGTVLDALLELQRRGLEPRALIGEGRPGFEGRSFAAEVAAAKIPVWLVVDAALPLLLSQASAVWIGADAVTDQGAINKIGSFAAALAAREHSVPVYALADRRRFLPAATPALKIVEMPSAEVWDAPAEGVQPRNVYFELVPMPLLRGVVVEDTVLGPTEAAATARERPLPEELAR
jgi:translation initiation factor eIF-2B subunit delta